MPPQVGDWIFLDDNADGTICEVVKVVHLAGKSTGDVDVIVDLVGPFDTVNDVLGYARHRDSLVSDCVRSLVSQKLTVEG
ncbi:hypothetical protein SDC9_206786 [bioreactor metagenome]|uniref:Uncharacterized protein n=1 Tax=bioreactor metagenome TaxID=1076179 RepID=A0A645J5Z4_9ZZZZ